VTGKRTWAAAFGLALLGSQAGHLFAYQLRFGAVAQHVQSTGAHAYFPLLAKTSVGVVAAAMLAALFFVGLARALSGRSRSKSRSGPSYIRLLAILFTVQLACFVAQEVGETLVAGLPVDSAPHLLLWGTLGQLPVAALASLALCWMASRFESALVVIRAALTSPAFHHGLTTAAAPAWSAPARSLIQSSVAGASLVKRGPPTSLRISTY
jgi:hypothetical protein